MSKTLITNNFHFKKTILISDWISEASQKLSKANIPSAKLDAELIIAHTLKQDRTYIHAHPEQIISSDICKFANKLLKKRLKRLPLAYLLKHKEFYGRNFYVNKHVLIPRPESEEIIELLQAHALSNQKILVDVGTGSGCLGITAKLEKPSLSVTLIDVSASALSVAKTNAKKLSADVSFLKSNLLTKYASKIDILVANLPYVDKSWETSPETKYEPSLALFADDNGLQLIYSLLFQAKTRMNDNGLIFIEADPSQHNKIISFASKYNYSLINKKGYIVVLQQLNCDASHAVKPNYQH